MSIYKQDTNHWYLERVIFALAGIFVLASVALAITISEYFLYFTLFVGALMTLFAFSGYCPMAIILNKIGVQEKGAYSKGNSSDNSPE